MPEGPELAFAAAYIQRICKGKTFSRIFKSALSKCADVPWNDGDNFTVSAVSRGKELMLTVKSVTSTSNSVNPGERYILFHFGMSGRFTFTTASASPKHAHLSFITSDGVDALHFVDTRRFGKWETKASPDEWTPERGPCSLAEYNLFRENVSKSLDDHVFNRPLCEAMLDQRYFNGIGNYLRAEIIYRAGVPPFNNARTVLRQIFDKKPTGNDEPDKEEDLLAMCKTVQEEAIALQTPFYDSHSMDEYYYSAFEQWVKCYGKSSMSCVKDANGRTMWFAGAAGSMAKRVRDRKVTTKRKQRQQKNTPKTDDSDLNKRHVQKEGNIPNISRKRNKRDTSMGDMREMHEEAATNGKNRTEIPTLNNAVIGVITRNRAKLLRVAV